MNDLRHSASSGALASETAEPTEIIKHLAYAEASVMLIECLMLALMERGVLTGAQMVMVVENAIATKRRMVADHEHPQISAVAVGVLSALANSLAATKV